MNKLNPRYPRKCGLSRTLTKRDVGLYYWCAYWGHWDRITAVDGIWISVIQCDVRGNEIGDPRQHCTAMDAALFADKPFQVEHNRYEPHT